MSYVHVPECITTCFGKPKEGGLLEGS